MSVPLSRSWFFPMSRKSKMEKELRLLDSSPEEFFNMKAQQILEESKAKLWLENKYRRYKMKWDWFRLGAAKKYGSPRELMERTLQLDELRAIRQITSATDASVTELTRRVFELEERLAAKKPPKKTSKKKK